MRILNVSAQKPDSTGSGVYLAETVRCQLSAGHRAAAVCGIDREDTLPFDSGVAAYPVLFRTDEVPFPVAGMSDEMPYEATRYRDMDAGMVAAFREAFSRRIRAALAEFRPDVAVCHHLYLLTALVRDLAQDVPVFAVCHSTDLRQMRTHGLEREAIMRGVNALDGVFALHDEQRREIIELFGCDGEKVQVLGTGYNARLFSPAPHADSAALHPEEASISLLYVGKIWEKKGVGCLLDALDLLPGEWCPPQVNLVGGHNDEDEYRAFVHRAASCRATVRFAGRLGADDLARAYRDADVFVLPSFFEGLPLVVVEALACGCRVVVSDLPGIRPWLSAHVPDAPVVYVRPPRMRGADTPITEDLPAFSRRIAEGIEQAVRLGRFRGDLSSLTWEGLTERMVALMEECVARLDEAHGEQGR